MLKGRGTVFPSHVLYASGGRAGRGDMFDQSTEGCFKVLQPLLDTFFLSLISCKRTAYVVLVTAWDMMCSDRSRVRVVPPTAHNLLFHSTRGPHPTLLVLVAIFVSVYHVSGARIKTSVYSNSFKKCVCPTSRIQLFCLSSLLSISDDINIRIPADA